MSRSSALRFAGLSSVSRATCGAGSSSRSLPPARSSISAHSLEHAQGVALVDGLALLAADLGHGALVLGLDRHLHLHGLQDHDRVALLDLVADLDLDLPHAARHAGL